MKPYRIIAVCLLGGLILGCEERLKEPAEDKNLDAELVKTLNNIGVENAIIAQHTLYPYHFVPDGGQLIELGRRDLGVLAKHFAEHAGTLNVRRGDAPAELYEARVASVMQGLKEMGVNTARMNLSDGMPGGTGMASERVVTILKEEPKISETTQSGSSGFVGQKQGR